MNDQQTDGVECEVDGPARIPEFEDPKIEVTRLLDQAVAKAQDAGMTTSDLLGILHYYAHCVAASYRDTALRQSSDSSDQTSIDGS